LTYKKFLDKKTPNAKKLNLISPDEEEDDSMGKIAEFVYFIIDNVSELLKSKVNEKTENAFNHFFKG
jgi:hypothetical protein